MNIPGIWQVGTLCALSYLALLFRVVAIVAAECVLLPLVEVHKPEALLVLGLVVAEAIGQDGPALA